MTLNEIKNIPDPGVQKEVILKNIETIQGLAQADFGGGCGSAMAVSPMAHATCTPVAP